MINKLRKSLLNINYKLFFALLFMGLCPTIYSTLRVFWLGQIPGNYSFSIAGQLSWVNLFYEILNEAIILPLFYFIGKVIRNKKEIQNRIRSGLLISFILYFILSIVIFVFAKQLLSLMATIPEIIEESVSYIRLESIANIFLIIIQFVVISLVTIGKDKYVYFLTLLHLIFSIITDIFLISSFDFSMKLGVNGIAISNIIINFLLFLFGILLLKSEDISIISNEKLDFKWCKELFYVGGISGLESFVRNIFYMAMICRMVNVVGEQGTYWVANNFIWGWLLLPIIQLGELIKKEVSIDRNSIKNNTLGYLVITVVICLIWFLFIPLYKPFMLNILQFNEVDKLFELVMILLGFYVLYAIQNVFDSIFYSLGKTNYMLFESIITNVIYYGFCFLLYINGVWQPSLLGIALMFGIGNLFDSVVSFVAFRHLLKKEKINIFSC